MLETCLSALDMHAVDQTRKQRISIKQLLYPRDTLDNVNSRLKH